MDYPFASLMLLAWVPFTLFLCTRLSAPLAVSISIVGAGALLPTQLAFDFPGVPPLDRDALAALASLAGCVLLHPRFVRARPPGRGLEVLTVGIALAAFGTALMNSDPVNLFAIRMPPLTLYDGLSTSAGAFLSFGIPFYLGRALFRTPRDLAVLLGVLAVGGIFYSFLVAWEVRMSPQLHDLVYGFQPASFAQAKRGTLWGWRPMVFVGHGLSLTMLVLSCGIAAAGLWRARQGLFGQLGGLITPYLYALLIACQSLGSALLGTLAFPCVMLLRPSLQGKLMALICIAVLSYPLLRAFDLLPTQYFVDQAQTLSSERAASLQFRFDNEDILIERARERLFLGWGGFGRARVYDELGEKASVTDGYWIIVMGQSGLIGFVLVFGLMIFPVLAAAPSLARWPIGTKSVLVATTAWIATLGAVDLLPNGFLNSRMVFIAGALMGALQGWTADPVPEAEASDAAAPEAPAVT